MTKRKHHNRAPSGTRPRSQKNTGKPTTESSSGLILYGFHAVRAALENPARHCHALTATDSALEALKNAKALTHRPKLPITRQERREIDRLLPDGAVHQGMVLSVDPLSSTPLTGPQSLSQPATEDESNPGDYKKGTSASLLVAFDQITDPQNAGAILRSAAAFGADGVVMTQRHSPPESGALAKAAAGALDMLRIARIGNLARGLEELKEQGYWILGMEGTANQTIDDALPGTRIVLVLGAEGAGLRRLTQEKCDRLIKIPMRGDKRINHAILLDSLNVSAAAAVALYELSKKLA